MSRGFTSEYSSEAALVVKNHSCQCTRDMSKVGSSWVEKIPQERNPFLPGESRKQRSFRVAESQTIRATEHMCTWGRGRREKNGTFLLTKARQVGEVAGGFMVV